MRFFIARLHSTSCRDGQEELGELERSQIRDRQNIVFNFWILLFALLNFFLHKC